MSTFSVELPDLLAERLRLEAARRRVALDTVVREALESTLPLTVATIVPSKSLAEAASSFAGRFDGPSDLATNPCYLDDFGK